MANIDSYLSAIKQAVYGEEVRGSIHDAIKEVNEEKMTGVAEAAASAEQANNLAQSVIQLEASTRTAATEAQNAAASANEALSSVTTMHDDVITKASEADQAKAVAETKAAEALASAENAANSIASIGDSVDVALKAANSAEEAKTATEAYASQVSEDKTATETYRDEAKQYRDEAKQVAEGDFVTHAEVGVSVASLNEGKVPKEQLPEDIGGIRTFNSEEEYKAAKAAGEIEDGTVIGYPSEDDAINIATTSKAGIVKPDGDTLTIEEDGTMHAKATSADYVFDTLAEAQEAITSGKVEEGATVYVREGADLAPWTVDAILSLDSENPVQNKVVTEAINDLKKSVSDGKTTVANAITAKGIETATDATFDVMAENITKIETGVELHGAVISVTTEETTLIGKDVVLKKDEAVIETKQFDDNGACSFIIQEPGTYSISSSDGTDNSNTTVDVTDSNIINKTVLACELSFISLVPFSTASIEDLEKMVNAFYNDKFTLDDIKSVCAVGDMRSVDLSAMEATGVGESHRAQTVQYVILDFEHDELTTPINGHTKALFSIGQKDCLMDATSASNSNNGSNNTENGYMNSSSANYGGWRACARRTWCNNVYFNALPTEWQNMVKEVNKKASIGSSSNSIETVTDKIFLAAEIEVFGSITYSVAGEGTQYQYYKNATANRYKMPKLGSSNSLSNIWWVRSRRGGMTQYVCRVYDDGNTDCAICSTAYGIAPHMCI